MRSGRWLQKLILKLQLTMLLLCCFAQTLTPLSSPLHDWLAPAEHWKDNSITRETRLMPNMVSSWKKYFLFPLKKIHPLKNIRTRYVCRTPASMGGSLPFVAPLKWFETWRWHGIFEWWRCCRFLQGPNSCSSSVCAINNCSRFQKRKYLRQMRQLNVNSVHSLDYTVVSSCFNP